MMHYVETVEIEHFWGSKKVLLNLKDDINFLIGVNGSGKTTVINLIAATLNADFPTLDRFQFSKIEVVLCTTDKTKRNKAIIKVEKKDQKQSPFDEIIFSIKRDDNDRPKEYLLDEIEGEQLFRYQTDFRYSRVKHRGSTERDVHSMLSTLLSVSWLSIHRSSNKNSSVSWRNEDKSYESSVDQKIEELSNNLVKYFSTLDRKSRVETDKFEQFVFLSLLQGKEDHSLSFLLNDHSPNIEYDKASLRDIFSLFKVPESKYAEELELHYDLYVKSRKKLEEKTPNVSISDLTNIINTNRINTVVGKWKSTSNNQKEIFKSRDIFLEVINNLLNNKSISISEKNELVVNFNIKGSSLNRQLPLSNLSSGEKQLLIILGECLLQEQRAHIYIADEPELSLHVEWQEKIVHSIKSLNPNVQIIFATHSPDIVSSYSDSVIHIEDAIKNQPLNR